MLLREGYKNPLPNFKPARKIGKGSGQPANFNASIAGMTKKFRLENWW
jgi:hypothetical protein